MRRPDRWGNVVSELFAALATDKSGFPDAGVAQKDDLEHPGLGHRRSIALAVFGFWAGLLCDRRLSAYNCCFQGKLAGASLLSGDIWAESPTAGGQLIRLHWEVRSATRRSLPSFPAALAVLLLLRTVPFRGKYTCITIPLNCGVLQGSHTNLGTTRAQLVQLREMIHAIGKDRLLDSEMGLCAAPEIVKVPLVFRIIA
jgi:hypothetical protein